jgi:hypothetical protein
LRPPEIAALAEAIDPRYRAMVFFDAYCGLRLGELAGLRRGRLDLLHHEVRVSEIAVEVKGELLFGPPKTRAGNRKVSLPRFVVDELTAHLERFGLPGPDALVFVGADGGALRANGWRARHWRSAIGRRDWSRSGHTTCGTPPSPCGWRRGRARSRSPRGPGTRPCRWSWTATGTCSPAMRTPSSTGSRPSPRPLGWPPVTSVTSDSRGARGVFAGQTRGTGAQGLPSYRLTCSFTVGDGGFEPSTSAV